MEEFKCPKVIEKTPEVMGLKVGVIVVVLGCALCFVLMLFQNFLIACLFPCIGGGYYFVAVKFPAKGELTQYIKYETGHHCIKMDQELKTIIKTT